MIRDIHRRAVQGEMDFYFPKNFLSVSQPSACVGQGNNENRESLWTVLTSLVLVKLTICSVQLDEGELFDPNGKMDSAYSEIHYLDASEW